MGRRTVYNDITSPEKLAQVNPENIQLGNDFLEYLSSIDRAKSTIYQYNANLNVFWCWNMEFNNNKFYVKITKREFAKFQNHAKNVYGWSPKRIRTVKATLSSLGKYIENILDDEFEGFRSIVNSIESPADNPVREKSVFSEQELKELLNKLERDGEYMYACMLALAMNSGRRKTELAEFKVAYFEDKNLICGGAMYKTPEKMRTKGRGSNGKMLDVYVLAKGFTHYLNLWMKERERLGIESQWLFPKVQCHNVDCNEHISTSAMDYAASVFTKMLGQPFYWHSMRHFFTTKLVESNIPDSVIQAVIGWDSVEMVKVYSDVTPEAQFEKYFGGEDGIKKVEQGSLTRL